MVLRLARTIALAIPAALALAALMAPAHAVADPPPAGANDFSCEPSADHPRPVVLVHGLGATMSGNWSYVSPELAAEGYCVFALTYGVDPRTEAWPYSPGGIVRMEESAAELADFVEEVLAATGSDEVDLVGHSQGTVMPRWYLERLGGAERVNAFVALTPLWRGTELGGLPTLRDELAPLGLPDVLLDLVSGFCASCPQFLRGSEYLEELNADGEAVPGVEHTNIMTRLDELVHPYTSGWMQDGGTNIILQAHCPSDLSEHLLVAFSPAVLQFIKRALDPQNAAPVRC